MLFAGSAADDPGPPSTRRQLYGARRTTGVRARSNSQSAWTTAPPKHAGNSLDDAQVLEDRQPFGLEGQMSLAQFRQIVLITLHSLAINDKFLPLRLEQ